ncbi:hypothetical protein BZL30_9456 [Mycobacterium kansasii]|uniref:Uncharacterized protein n=1 Tax=Mycobacterium kansasii TaxID=1768 RepID=A0A1V3WAR4_MYCKA|nr:hypothetical protein BZL30_9456 [Mycobacterium kansasii]
MPNVITTGCATPTTAPRIGKTAAMPTLSPALFTAISVRRFARRTLSR